MRPIQANRGKLLRMRRLPAASIALLSLACATTSSTTAMPPVTPAPKPPEWLNLNGSIEVDDTADCAHSRFGVGGVSRVTSKVLRTKLALTQARADMSARLRACWSKRLEGKFPHRSEISDEEPKVSYEEALSQMVSLALDRAVVVEQWEPDEATEWVYLTAK